MIHTETTIWLGVDGDRQQVPGRKIFVSASNIDLVRQFLLQEEGPIIRDLQKDYPSAAVLFVTRSLPAPKKNCHA